jgi:hypothetical protein
MADVTQRCRRLFEECEECNAGITMNSVTAWMTSHNTAGKSSRNAFADGINFDGASFLSQATVAASFGTEGAPANPIAPSQFLEMNKDRAVVKDSTLKGCVFRFALFGVL